MADGHPGHERLRGEKRRRVVRTPIAILAIAAVLAVSAVAVRAFASESKGRGCDAGIKLSIAASPDIQPAVADAAARWAGTNPKVNGQCVRVVVSGVQPVEVAGALARRAGGTLTGAAQQAAAQPSAAQQAAAQPSAAQPSAAQQAAAQPSAAGSGADGSVPAIWIPDSIAWLRRTQVVDPNAFSGATPSVALSPVMLAMPEAFATSILAGKPRLSAADLAALMKKVGTEGKDPVTFATADPNVDSAALAGAMMLRNLLGPTVDKAATVVGAYRSIGVAATTAELVKGVKPRMAVAVTEQTILSVDADGPPTVLGAVPLEQPLSLDYPLAVVSGNSTNVTRAAERFRTALASGEYRNIFSREGFRAPNGTTSADFQAEHGVTADPVAPVLLTDSAKIDEVFSYWTAAKVPSRVLSLIDVTSSMRQPTKLANGTTATRIDLVRRAAVNTFGLFNDASTLGVWTFGATSKQLIPTAPLTAAQRTKLTAAVTGAAVATSDSCGLYDALLSAFKAMRDSYQADRLNTLVVYTDGSNNTKTGLTADQLRDGLQTATDDGKPVRVILVGVGPNANNADLSTIAGYVKGQALAVTDLNQLTESVLQALLTS